MISQWSALDGRKFQARLCRVNVEHLRARPRESFRPFVLVTSSGNKYPVPHPDFLFITERTVIVADHRGYTTTLDPQHIVGLEDTPSRRDAPR